MVPGRTSLSENRWHRDDDAHGDRQEESAHVADHIPETLGMPAIEPRFHRDCSASEFLIDLIEIDGRLVAQKGSHRQYKHPAKSGKVTIAGKPTKDIPKGALNSILRQAGLK